ncbi:MAG TPA: HAD hydrolase family protein [Bacteroidota bacterium]|nr:HAD hydrolase family protein [Bacteroidota bacterium]
MPSELTIRKSLEKKLAPIKMILLDVDGVLTDGMIIFGSDGTEYRHFDAHDGFGITRAMSLGLKFAVISGKKSKATELRIAKLGIKELYQNRMDKILVYQKVKSKYRLKGREFCFIGDDDFDLPLLKEVGFSAAPIDAMETVRGQVDYVATRPGGRGAVREVIDMILRTKRLL